MFIYTAEAIKKIDIEAEKQGLSPFTLMENAGRSVAMHIMANITERDDVLILAGRGNNGGDGIVAARYIRKAGYKVMLTFPLGEPKTDSAKAHLNYYLAQGNDVSAWDATLKPDVIVDALLGISTRLPLRDHVLSLVRWCNEQDAKRIAIDLPTGVQADHGAVDKADAIIADATLALHGLKPSAFLHPSGDFYGKVTPVDIGLKQESDVEVISLKQVQQAMPKRAQAAHKGTFGTSMLLAGSDEMPGSALLATIGAIRSGTGRLIVGTTPFVASVIASTAPEATYQFDALEEAAQGKLPGKISAIGIGPGISDDSLAAKAVEQLLQTEIPLVVDAGALLHRKSWQRKTPLVLTPHPGEFSRLTGMPIKEIQANRIAVAREFAQKHQLILVLKGQHTVIAFPNGHVFINPTGNSGLAKGGSGDVLTGIVLSMLSYYESAEAAVVNAVYIHGLCAEKWAEENGEAGMAASDFQQLLPQVLKELE